MIHYNRILDVRVGRTAFVQRGRSEDRQEDFGNRRSLTPAPASSLFRAITKPNYTALIQQLRININVDAFHAVFHLWSRRQPIRKKSWRRKPSLAEDRARGSNTASRSYRRRSCCVELIRHHWRLGNRRARVEEENRICVYTH